MAFFLCPSVDQVQNQPNFKLNLTSKPIFSFKFQPPPKKKTNLSTKVEKKAKTVSKIGNEFGLPNQPNFKLNFPPKPIFFIQIPAPQLRKRKGLSNHKTVKIIQNQVLPFSSTSLQNKGLESPTSKKSTRQK